MNAIDIAWNFVFESFYCEKTELIYDFLVDKQHPATFGLPTPAEIQAQIPNPCGWGTGMEDSVLNGGSALDAVVAEYAATGDARLKETADHLFAGLMRCASVSKDPGFIARSVSPEDEKSYYFNSSRDQYTHWVYAAVRFYDSPLSDEEQRQDIRRILRKIAEKCERDVREENDYNMLRADGKIGIIGQMCGDIGAHEYLRLPMFYAAAYYVTKEIHWKEMCDRYLAEGIEKTEPFEPQKHRGYVTLQLQYSLRLLYDVTEDSSIRERLLILMNRFADYAENLAVQKGEMLCTRDKEEFCFRYRPWNQCGDMIYHGEFGGYPYYNPAQSERKENKSFYPPREVGEAASVAAICPHRAVNELVMHVLEKLADYIDYENHYTYAPLLIACGYKLCMENRTVLAQSSHVI